MMSRARKLRAFLGRQRRSFKQRLRQGGRLSQLFYYGIVSDAFRRERAVVAAGHREYGSRYTDRSLEFLLRRNTHMIEKGLTMRPRRKSFAGDYIGETVELFDAMSGAEEPIISSDVVAWSREVLTRYLEATAESEDERVVAARLQLIEMNVGAGRDFVSGPHEPTTASPPVAIDQMIELATRRKSVRWFEQRTVERDVVDRAVDVAEEAPSACNRQPFHFRIFDDPEMVEKVARIPMGTAGYGHNLPGLVVIVGDLSAFSDERDRHLIYTDGCLAAMSFIFGLEAQGVASVCINWPDIEARDVRMSQLLNLMPYERVVMLIGYGYADSAGHTPYSAKRGLRALRRYNAL